MKNKFKAAKYMFGSLCLLIMMGVFIDAGTINIHAAEAKTAKAILCDNGNMTFVYDATEYQTGDVYKSEKGKGTITNVYTVPLKSTGEGDVPWHSTEGRPDITSVSVFKSFEECDRITSLNSFFKDLKYCESIDGLRKIDTENVTDMTSMFENYGVNVSAAQDITGTAQWNTNKVTSVDKTFKNAKVKSISLTEWEFNASVSATETFAGNTNLALILSNSDWTVNGCTGTDTFLGCTSLVGGIDTVYDENHVGPDYAKVGTELVPGYFSGNTTVLYAKFNDENLYKDKEGKETAAFPEITRAGFELDGFYSEIEGGAKVLNADGSFSANTVTDWIDSAKWSLTKDSRLFARWNDVRTAKVLLCEDNNLVFVFDDIAYAQGDAYTDNLGETSILEIYDIETENLNFQPDWVGNNDVTSTYVTDGFYAFKPTFTCGWFAGLPNLESYVGLENIDMSNVTYTAYMFTQSSTNCSVTDPVVIDMSSWDTSSLISTYAMFQQFGQGFTDFELNVTGWDVSNVIYMSYMFNQCATNSMMKPFMLRGFNSWVAQNIEETDSMFGETNITTEDLMMDFSDWDASGITYANNMFYGCYNVNIEMSESGLGGSANYFGVNMMGWTMENCIEAEGMFADTLGLTTIYCDHDWDELENLYGDFMFYNEVCGYLESAGLTVDKLTGGNGTEYPNAGEGLSAAVVDRTEKQGYFTLYKESYTISYDANGGTGAPESQTKKAGETINLSTTIPTYEGHTFYGWSADQKALRHTYEPGQEFSRNADMTLYAVWEEPNILAILGANGNLNFVCSDNTYNVGDTYEDNIGSTEIVEIYEVPINFMAISDPESELPWFYNTNVTTANIDESFYRYSPQSTRFMFASLVNLHEITNLDNLNMSRVMDAEYMFAMVGGMVEEGLNLDLRDLDVSSVKDMDYMFAYTGNESTDSVINIDGWNTENVSSIKYMFAQCVICGDFIGLSNINTGNVVSAKYAFCESYIDMANETFDISGWDVQNLKYTWDMFYSARIRMENGVFDLSGWNVDNLEDADYMFYDFGNPEEVLYAIDLTGWNPENMQYSYNMFQSSEMLSTILCENDWSVFEANENSWNMFDGCYALVGGNGTMYDKNHTDVEYARPDGINPGYFTAGDIIVVYNANGGAPTPASQTHKKGVVVNVTSEEPEKEDDNFHGWALSPDAKTAAYTAGDPLPAYCNVLLYAVWDPPKTAKAILGSNGNLNFVYDDNEYAVGDTYTDNLGSTTITNIYDVPKELEDWEKFEWTGTSENGRSDITSVNFSDGFEKYHIQDVKSMFYCDKYISSITNAQNLNLSETTMTSSMFYYVGSEVETFTADLSSLDMSNVTDANYMFYNVGKNASSWDIGDISKWDTSNIVYMGYMFCETGSIEVLDLSGWDTSSVESLQGMFNNSKVKELNMAGWETKDVTFWGWTFDGCQYLQRVTVGDKFVWHGDQYTYVEKLPKPDSNYIPGADGYWHNEETYEIFANYQLPNNVAATYNAVPKYTPKAILGDNGNLNFVFDDITYTAGNTYTDNLGSTTIAAVYSVPRYTSSDASTCGWIGTDSNRREDITSVNFTEGFKNYKIQGTSSMFYYDGYISSITNPENLNTSKANSMFQMFYFTGMSSTNGIRKLDLSEWNTENVTDMQYMFSYCKVKELDISGFSTKSLIGSGYQYSMFSGCSYLYKITLGENFEWLKTGPNYRLPKPSSYYIKNADQKWYNVDTEVGYYPDDIPNKTAATYTAVAPTKYAKAILGDNGNLNFIYDKAYYCVGDTYKDNLGTTAITAVYDVPQTLQSWESFAWAGTSDNGRSDITSVNFSDGFEDYHIKTVNDMFYYDKYIESITNAENLNLSEATSTSSMFYYTGSEAETFDADLSGLDMSTITSMSYMFYSTGKNATSWNVGDISEWDTSNVTDMGGVFSNTGNIEKLDLSGWDTTSVTSVQMMFYNSKVKELDMSGWSTGDITYWSQTFAGCIYLKRVTVGADFVWHGDYDTTRLPKQTSDNIPGADGYWHDESTYEKFLNTQIPSNVAATYNAVPKYTPKAVLGANGNLNFVFDDVAYTVGNTYTDNIGSTEIVAVYSVPMYTSQSTSTCGWIGTTSDGRTDITSANFDESFKNYRIKSTSYMFFCDKYISSITNIDNLNISKAENMSYMFYYTGTSATEMAIDGISNIDTSNITNMGGVFYGTGKIKKLDLSGWNTDKVTTMRYMFYNSKVKELDISGFNTKAITESYYQYDMFWGCWYLEKISLGKDFEWLATGNDYRLPKPSSSYIPGADGKWHDIVTDKGYVPDSVPNKTAGTYTAIPKTTAKAILGNNGNLNFVYDDVTYTVGETYTDNLGSTTIAAVYSVPVCSANSSDIPWANNNSITSANFTDNFAGFEPNSIAYWLYGDKYISSITNVKNINTTAVNNIYGFLEYTGFYATSFVADMTEFDVGNLKSLSFLFSDTASTATTVDIGDISGWDTSNVTNMSYMFSNSGVSGSLDLSNWDTSKVTNMYFMFNCTKITELDLTGWNTAKVTNMGYMFNGARVTELDLSSFSTESITDKSGQKSMLSASRLKLISFGDDFEWLSTEAAYRLPKQSSPNVPGADGNWYNVDTDEKFAPAEVPSNTAATYTAIPPEGEKIARAILGDNGNLNFVYDDEDYAEGDDYTDNIGTTTIEAVYDVPDTIECADDVSWTGWYYYDEGDPDEGIEEEEDWDYREDITSINFDASFADFEMISTCEMFYMDEYVESITNIGNLNTSEVTNMSYMFYETGVEAGTFNADLSNLDTSSATTISYMLFDIGGNAEDWSIGDLSEWDVSNVEYMSSMFKYAGNSTDDWSVGDISEWDTSKVKSMSGMFQQIGQIETLDLSGWNTSKVTTMSYMFYGIETSEMDLTGFSTTAMTTSAGQNCMFTNCYYLEKITFGSGFKWFGTGGNYRLPTPSNKYIPKADGNWYNVDTEVGYTPNEIPSNTAATYTAIPFIKETAKAILGNNGNLNFVYDKNEYTVGSEYEDNLGTTTIVNVYNVPKSITGSNVVGWTGNSTSGSINYREDITSVNFDNSFATYELTQTAGMFYYDKYIASITNVKNLNTSKSTSMNRMFCQTGSEASTFNADLSTLNTGSATNMLYMLSYVGVKAESWNIGDLSGWNTEKVTNMYGMFMGAGNKTTTTWTIGDIGKWNVGKVTSMSYMFNKAGENAATWNIGDLEDWNVQNVTITSYMFSTAGKNATTWDIGDISDWNIEKLTNVSYMFHKTGNIQKLDLSGWDATKITNSICLFNESKVKEIDMSNWDNRNCTSCTYMFVGCNYLEKIKIGENLEWQGTDNYFRLPTPSSTYIPGADGYWYDVDTKEDFSPREMPSNKAATYVAIPFYKAKAILCENGNMSFVYNDTNYTVGNDFTTNIGNSKIASVFDVPKYATGSGSIPWVGNNNITSVDFTESFKTYRPRSIQSWFYNDKYVSSITNIKNLNTKMVGGRTYGFLENTGYSASSFVADLTEFDVGNLQSLSYMFHRTARFATTVDIGDISGWDTSNVTSLSYMFCESGIDGSLDLSKWDTSKVTNMMLAFYNTDITELDVTGWDTSKVTNMSYMFGGIDVTELDLSSFSTESITDKEGQKRMFIPCWHLEQITFGEDFEWLSTEEDYRLLAPSKSYIPAADGKWYDVNTEVGYLPDEMPSGKAATYTAIPFIDAAIIVFDKNGGTGTMGNQTVELNVRTALSKNTFTRSGYTFAGWAYEKDGKVKLTDEQVVEFDSEKTITLYAVWKKGVHSLEIVGN